MSRRNASMLDNVRLWDWHAFHDTITQIQAAAPLLRYRRYRRRPLPIDGQMRQVLLPPRELDLSQLGDAAPLGRSPHFIYTHGYGLVLAEASQITPERACPCC